MNVLVDSAIWSLVLRRRSAQLNKDQVALRDAFVELVEEGRAKVIGAVRQEVLSGIRTTDSFEKVREYLRHFLDEPVLVEDHEKAAEVSNACMAAGIAASAIDALICAVAIRRGWQVYTTDRDFQRYAKVVPLTLFTS